MAAGRSRAGVRHIIGAGLAVLFGVQSAAVTAQSVPVDSDRGRLLSESERCQGCHGEFGDSDSPLIPKLAGQHAAYLSKQLRDFKSGARKHEIMSVMAAELADEDLADIADYFSRQQIARGEIAVVDATAKNLFLNGDAARNIVPCASCHGADGRGQSHDGISYPSIAGQHRKYLRAQLVKWSLGERSNSAGGVMNAAATALSGRELDDLCAYISSL